MAPQKAEIHSIEVLRTQKSNLQRYAAEVEAALIALEMEARRPVDWVMIDRSRYWPHEVRRAQDALCEARVALERCELMSSRDERRYCYDERKALEAAKRRLRRAEEKVKATRLWRVRIQKAADAFQTQLARLRDYMDSEMPRALAELERLAEALDRYVERKPPAAGPEAGSSLADRVNPP